MSKSNSLLPFIFEPNFKYHIVLHEPLIPQNTGTIGRLCVGTQSYLHFEPLGFSLDEREVKRAGLNYWKYVKLYTHSNFESWLNWFNENEPNANFYLIENKLCKNIFEIKLPKVAAFIFGKETTGLPIELLKKYEDRIIGIPMYSNQIRSINLANTVAITLYEAIRQQQNVK